MAITPQSPQPRGANRSDAYRSWLAHEVDDLLAQQRPPPAGAIEVTPAQLREFDELEPQRLTDALRQLARDLRKTCRIAVGACPIASEHKR
jgi:hypothetical protein